MRPGSGAAFRVKSLKATVMKEAVGGGGGGEGGTWEEGRGVGGVWEGVVVVEVGE